MKEPESKDLGSFIILFTKWGRVKNGKKFAKMNLSPFGKFVE